MRVNEIFYSLQGEGRYTGVPSVFVRLSGCNMKCWFCDTDHLPYTEMSEDDIVEKVTSYPTRHVVITGGEPTMQINSLLTSRLHDAGCFIQIETNGTLPLHDDVDIDWITCSPKTCVEKLAIQRIDELKLVYEAGMGQDELNPEQFFAVGAKEYRLQPCDVNDNDKNNLILKATINYILEHPEWKLSLQTHKMIDIR